MFQTQKTLWSKDSSPLFYDDLSTAEKNVYEWQLKDMLENRELTTNIPAFAYIYLSIN